MYASQSRSLLEGASVRLHGRNREQLIASDHVYFAFASGRLAYDCVACGSKCCRGHGYVVNTEQALYQISQRPALRFFIDHTARPAPLVRNCPPGCFFLREDLRCDIHARDGFAAKPETCRLFPFNRIRSVGDFLIVGPHESLCPLSIADEAKRDESNHEILLRGIVEQGIGDPVPHSVSTGLSDASLIRLERQIAVASEQLFGRPYVELVAAQIDILASTTNQMRENEGVSVSDSDAKRSVADTVEQMCTVLDVSSSLLHDHHRAEVDKVLVALTPVIRSHIVFRDPPNTGHDDCFRHGDLSRVPRILLATYILALLAADAGMTSITVQTVLRLHKEFHSLLDLLSLLESRMAWHGGAELRTQFVADPKFQTAYVKVARALLPEVQARSQARLGQIILQYAKWEGLDRIRFLRFLANRLHGKLVPLSHPFRSAQSRSPRAIIRTAVEKWAVLHLEAELVTKIVGRLPRQKNVTTT